jgi:hypothetical protein
LVKVPTRLHGHQRRRTERAAVQERVAERAAEVAQQAEREGQAELADILWCVARRSRVQALKLRAGGPD